MDFNKIISNIICIITPINNIEQKRIGLIVGSIFKTKNISIKGNIQVLSIDTITKAIDNHIKDEIRAIFISSQNINLISELNIIKQEWPLSATDICKQAPKKETIYFVIDVIPCSINNLKHRHLKDCRNIYSIELDFNM